MTENSVQEVKQMNLFSRIVGMFTSPGNTFQAIAVKPQWLIAALLSIAVLLGTMYATQSVTLKDQMEKTRENLEKHDMDQDQIDQILEKSQTVAKIAMYPSAAIIGFLAIIITAAVWLFLSNTILGGEATYKQMLGVVSYSGFIPLLGALIKIPLILSQQTSNIHFSLAAMMPDEQMNTFLYHFLSNLDFFNIWSLIAISIGVAVMGKMNVKKVWPWVVIVSLLFYAGAAALAGISGN